MAGRKQITSKAARFVEVFGRTGSRQQAVAAAGFSKRTLQQATTRAMRTARKVLARRQAQIARVADLQKATIVNLLACMVLTRLEDIVEWDGKALKVKAFSDIPGEYHPAIESVKQGADGALEVKLADRVEVIRELNRMMGWYAPRPQVEVTHVANFGLFLDVRGRQPGPQDVPIPEPVSPSDTPASGDARKRTRDFVNSVNEDREQQ